MKKITILIVLVFISACGKRITTETLYFPELNKIATAEVGENMFSKTNAYFPFKYFAVLEDRSDQIKYRTNERGRKFAELEGTKCAMHNGSLSLLDYNCDGIFTHLRNGERLEKQVKYKLIPAQPRRIYNNSFKREIIYQGKVGNRIKISFQEFAAVNGRFIIRDAYTQSIEYELDKNGKAIIGFKGLRIKVLKATNLKITYQVISDFR
jgi:hypothetical protein